MIKVDHLTKYYGDFLAVDDLSFEINEGHVYGFLGPNGAGKSTTMNIIAGCLSATSGTVTIGGCDLYEEPIKCKKMIGYLTELPPLYVNETPYEYLQFVGEAKGIKGTELKKQIQEVMEKTGIVNVQDRLISSLSKGYKQRVGIAQALLGNPKVIILDEPTVGLDPIQIIEIRDLIKDLGETHTVIFSSHILSEVQAICEEVMIIAKGKLVAFDTPENLEVLLTQGNSLKLKVGTTVDRADEILKNAEISDYTCESLGEDTQISVNVKADTNVKDLSDNLFFIFAGEKVPIYEMTSKKASLEEVFIELTEGTAEIENPTEGGIEE